VRCLPFRPDMLVSFPCVLSHGALQEAMLRRFLLVVVANLSEREKAHDLEPCPDREASVKNQPDERAHLPWARVVPDSGRQLSRGGVSQVEVFEKGRHA
jgi:hypothetical protein